jgi:hypothetical protein
MIFKRTLQNTLNDIGLKVPASTVKAFHAAFDEVKAAIGLRDANKVALESAESEAIRLTANVATTKAEIGLALVNGATDAQATADIRAVRDAQDLNEARISGLRRQQEVLDIKVLTAAEAFDESRRRLNGAVIEGMQERFAAMSSPFVIAIQQFQAVDDALRLNLPGLSHNRVCDPTMTPIFDATGIEPWNSIPAALALNAEFAPFQQMAGTVKDLLQGVETERRNEKHRADMADMQRAGSATAWNLGSLA